MPAPRTMNIGRFARLCRLSIKALRFYDEQRLLSPAEVDPRTGYRSYRREQVRDAVVVAMLRSLDVPVERVRALLDAQRDSRATELAALLAAERARVERQLRRAQRSLRSLDALLSGDGALLPYAISTRDEPELVVASARSTCDSEALEEHTFSMVSSLGEALARAGRSLLDPVGSILPLASKSETLDLIVFCGVSGDLTERDTRALSDAGVTIERWPARSCAVTVHTGPYESLALAHHALLAWTHERGYEEPAFVREHYLDDPTTTDDAQLRTEVLVSLSVP